MDDKGPNDFGYALRTNECRRLLVFELSGSDGLCWWSGPFIGLVSLTLRVPAGTVPRDAIRRSPVHCPLSRTRGCDENFLRVVSPGASSEMYCSAGPDTVLSHTEEKKVEGLKVSRALTETAWSPL